MMNYNVIDINGKRFLRLELVKVQQKAHAFYLAKAPADEIVKMFTVRPAKYDLKKYNNLSVKFPEEKDYYKEIIQNKNNQITEFQRDEDASRVKNIAEYISANEYPFFPNTIICTCDLLNIDDRKNYLDIINEYYDDEQTLSFVSIEDEQEYLILPIVDESILIIDGQHRLKGLKKYFADNGFFPDKYEILLSFFINHDRAIVAQQFYTINYEQKAVNKSILYHLMGEFSDEINELTLLHNFVRVLNELNKSPFHNRIKMLGKTPTEVSKEEKVLFSISQAFLIDELLKTISSKAINSLYQPIFLKYFNDSNKQLKIIRFIIRYFDAVKSLKPEWEKPDESILSKGMGVGALIKVMQLVFPILLFDHFKGDGDQLIDVETSKIVEYLKGIEEVDLTEFSGQGSAGSMNKIKECFIENMVLFGKPKYSDFEINFKEKYLPRFKDWNK